MHSRPTIEPHDVVVDSKGIAWYSNFGEQNIGRDGGTGTGRPQGEAGEQPPVGGVLDEVLGGILHANPFARTLG